MVIDAYSKSTNYGKWTLSLTLLKGNEVIQKTIGHALVFRLNGVDVPALDTFTSGLWLGIRRKEDKTLKPEYHPSFFFFIYTLGRKPNEVSFGRRHCEQDFTLHLHGERGCFRSTNSSIINSKVKGKRMSIQLCDYSSIFNSTNYNYNQQSFLHSFRYWNFGLR